MKNKYILLRHGQTKYQAEKLKRIYSDYDNLHLPLTKKGEEMIKDSVEKLKKEYKIDLIFASPFYRTTQSAKIASKILGIEVRFDKRLKEVDVGTFKGGLGSDYQGYFLRPSQKWTKRTPKGESFRDVKKRGLSFIKEIDKKYKNKTILVISHGDIIWILNGTLKGFTEKKILENWSTKGIYPKVAEYIKI